MLLNPTEKGSQLRSKVGNQEQTIQGLNAEVDRLDNKCEIQVPAPRCNLISRLCSWGKKKALCLTPVTTGQSPNSIKATLPGRRTHRASRVDAGMHGHGHQVAASRHYDGSDSDLLRIVGMATIADSNHDQNQHHQNQPSSTQLALICFFISPIATAVFSQRYTRDRPAAVGSQNSTHSRRLNMAAPVYWALAA